MMMIMMVMTMMKKVMTMTVVKMPGNVDDGSSFSKSYRSKRPANAVRPRPGSALNFYLNWSELVDYRDPVMLLMQRDQDPP